MQGSHRDSSTQNHNVKHSRNSNEVAPNQEVRANEPFQDKETDRKRQWYNPKWEGIKMEQFLECLEIIFKCPGKPGRNLNSGCQKEVSNATDAADQNMTREETNERAQPAYTHQEEYQAGQD
jgi:hypothetical protein